MSESIFPCPGCSGKFSHPGFSRHLAQTTHPPCVAVRRQQDTYVPANDSSDIEDDSQDPHASSLPGALPDRDVNMEQEAENNPAPYAQFEGDYFGDDYAEEDFGWEEPDEPDDGDEPGSDEEAGDLPVNVDDLAGPDWEPPPSENPLAQPHEWPGSEEELAADLPDIQPQSAAEQRLANTPIVVKFTRGCAGAKVSCVEDNASQYRAYQAQLNNTGNVWAPFNSQLDWEVARWAKLRGPGSTAFSELLKIAGIRERLGLSYRNSQELNKIVDEQVPGRPRFKREQIVIADQAFDVYYRDIIECIKALFGDPEFAPFLVFAPERHYADADQTTRLYHDMHTGKWWWSTQTELEKRKPGATIVPVIISSDKTQLTLFRNKCAYPVYLTIGNIPKDIRRKPSRRAQILLAYLPTTRLEHMQNKAARRRALANLFHGCMRMVLAPLEAAGIDGVNMASGDGAVRRCHTIFANFVGDYPEQLLVSCTKAGDCPTCPVPREELGDGTTYDTRDLAPILEALDAINQGHVEFTRACINAGIKPIFHPFWEDLPYVNIYRSITPDILHQLYQGLVKHLFSWLKAAFGPSEIDARCRRDLAGRRRRRGSDRVVNCDQA